MCCWSKRNKSKEQTVNSVHNANGEINNNDENSALLEIPEHVDNPFLNRHVQRGVLGFRYETKNDTVIVYSSIEAKTFCILMNLSPMHH